MFFKSKTGILGINARNLLYIRPYNKKKAVRMADDKLKSKQFLSARGIPVPKLFAVIRNQEELDRFDFSSLPSSFVLKPNMGFGGEGIIPIINRNEDAYEKASGQWMSQAELKEHIGDILEGRFSISGVSDSAFFEQRIVCHESLAKFAYKGLPDIRVVVHNLIPVMAMLRLPTRESDGKANIHQGALGVGIDIAKGTATHILHKGKIIDEVPEVGAIRGLKIPFWDEILLVCSRIQLTTNLGYLAVDMVLDQNVGPVLLEVNARAGLAVQIANLAPLRRRLERIEGVKVPTPEKGVRIAKDMFGNSLEKEVKKHTGKQVVGSHEKVKIIVGSQVRHVWASINPLLEQSIVDRSLAEELNIEEQEEGGSLRLKFILAEQRIQTLASTEDLSGRSFDLVIGRRDLNSFLIDPSLGKQKIQKLPHINPPTPMTVQGPNYAEYDRKIVSIERQIKLLWHLKPLNLKDEEAEFMKNNKYEPQFHYPDLKFDSFHLKEKIEKYRVELKSVDEPLAKLFLKKLQEINMKIDLLSSIGTNHFPENSIQLFDQPDEKLLQAAQKKLDSKPKHFKQSGKVYSMEEAIYEFERVLKSYELGHWKVKVKKSMVATCLAGKLNALFVREGAKFSEDHLRMLIAHEIETHILTAENGKQQNYRLFNRGFAGYLKTQEGLAIWNQAQVLEYDAKKNYRSATLVFVIKFAQNHSFSETYDYCRKLGMGPKRSFQTTLKVKRGLEDTGQKGAFTKDLIYFAGYLQVEDFVKTGGDLKDLYYGKYDLDDLEVIKQIPYLREPKVLPHFLS